MHPRPDYISMPKYALPVQDGEKDLRVLCFFRGKQLKGGRREAAREAGRFGGGLDAVISTSSVLQGGHGVVLLEEDAGQLPAWQ